MQYMPGFTVQCINPSCEARGQWMRADFTVPTPNDGHCPCCGDFLQNVPPPLGPRLRLRPRPLTARPHRSGTAKQEKPKVAPSALSLPLVFRLALDQIPLDYFLITQPQVWNIR
jgi:hypothetical protein